MAQRSVLSSEEVGSKQLQHNLISVHMATVTAAFGIYVKRVNRHPHRFRDSDVSTTYTACPGQPFLPVSHQVLNNDLRLEIL